MKVGLLFAALASTFLMSPAQAETGVTDTEIIIGMSNALSGPSAALGQGMKAGAQAHFDKLNAAGGINGRKIKLISLDDGYEPPKAAANTQKLIDEKAFLLFGFVGTPTSAAVLPIVNKADIPYVAPFTGAELLRTPVNKNVFNVRASYFDETEGLVDHFVKDLGVKKIGVFIQDDAYGIAGESGVLKALSKRGMSLSGKGTYARGSTAVDGAVEKLKAAAPEAIVMVGAYQACAEFVKKARKAGITAKFANVSFVGTKAFIDAAGADGEGVYISQVMPSPASDVPVVKDYQAAIKGTGVDPDYTSLEGYVGARILEEGLKKAGKDLTRDGFRKAMETLNTDVGGFKTAFSPSKHNASTAVYFTVIKGGKPVQVDKF